MGRGPAIDWKGEIIVFRSRVGSGLYDDVIKRIAPDGSNETKIIGPYWYDSVILRADGKWILYENGAGGWWQARRFDLNGNNDVALEAKGYHYFLVSAHAEESKTFYDSNVDSGYSVDNFPPRAPTGLLASVVNNKIELIWDKSPESDLHFYVIYRNGNFHDSTSYTQYQDANVEIGQSYSYKLMAVDVHENESDFSEEVTVILTHVDTDKLNLPKIYQLSQNYPNPFNVETLIQYQLPFTSHVELSIYNLPGQKIRTLVKAQENSDYYQVYWDGKDSDGFQVPSGIYLYQLRAGEFIQTRRMVLLK